MDTSLYRRPHHQRIQKALEAFDPQLLSECDCFFAGGTSIAMSLDEYRESVDIDFLCPTQDGYRKLRNLVGSTLDPLLCSPLKQVREVRADRYGIRTIIEVDGVAIKLEIVSEGRIDLESESVNCFPVPTLCKNDLFAEKLLANADRGLDKSVTSRDIIDLGMMIHHWGQIPEIAWQKAESAYGAQIEKSYSRSYDLITNDSAYLGRCLEAMKMTPDMKDILLRALPAKPTRSAGQVFNRSSRA